MSAEPKNWLKVKPEGLYCIPGDFYIDPLHPVDYAVITHGHSDHARGNNKNVLATAGTIKIMEARYGDYAGENKMPLAYGEAIKQKDVGIKFLPAGHIYGSAQAILSYKGSKVIVSGDYKRRYDPTCLPFEPSSGADVFITEATFGLPIFKHPPIEEELQKLLKSLKTFPERTHLVGAYALGKCQRLIMELRALDYNEVIYLHGALIKLCQLYQEEMNLGELAAATEVKDKEIFKGKIVLCPPSALSEVWSRRFPDPVRAVASGWMKIRARARQKLVDLPLVISDHADWDELTQTIHDVNAPEIWVTHGTEEALIHYAKHNNYRAKALSLIGYEDEDD